MQKKSRQVAVFRFDYLTPKVTCIQWTFTYFKQHLKLIFLCVAYSEYANKLNVVHAYKVARIYFSYSSLSKGIQAEVFQLSLDHTFVGIGIRYRK